MGTNKEELNRRYGFPKSKSHSIEEIAKFTKISPKTLQEVYKRGVGAHRTNPESVRVKGSFNKDPSAPISAKLSPQQWGMARVYSYANKVTGRRALNHDQDL